MTANPTAVPLERQDALYIRDVLDLADRYLRNPWRTSGLATGIAAACADGAQRLARHLDEKKEH
ncbi:hypothetical protein KDK95_06645 [Actinospica sp. MGRD01-02]|uniref:Uncharacterized protein n=1 Tax=Actinospica acidithermotolerans TaxID=2828514 RepID=A0A941E7M4_9ACTN|nr:hypothetical protein [Actinospica acidithermotolerans]MBR7825977.1 hypothetical protein [Actinospica acidithermotolerans]